MGNILNYGIEMVKRGHRFKIKKKYDDFFGSERICSILRVDQRSIEDYFGYAIWYNQGQDFRALEFVWSDENRKFPWKRGFDKRLRYLQPLLDRNYNFKFLESEDLEVYTTRQYLDLKKPILCVVHEEDGDWQFLTGDPIVEGDIRPVRLGKLVKQDLSLNGAFNLDYGEYAEREAVGAAWRRGLMD